MTHAVKDLSIVQKRAIESLLGRPVSDDESVSVKAIPGSAIRPSRLNDEERRAALDRVNRYFTRVDTGRQPVSVEEEDAITDEALRSTRPKYRPVG